MRTVGTGASESKEMLRDMLDLNKHVMKDITVFMLLPPDMFSIIGAAEESAIGSESGRQWDSRRTG